MVERSPFLKFVAHAEMILGVLIVAFPLYLAFVASTHTAQEIVQAPMPLLPGSHLRESYSKALLGGGAGAGSTAPVARMMWVSLVTALVITFGKITISLLSAFAIVDATTHGGPGQDTSILVYKVYYDGFKAMDLGGSAAQSVVLMAIVIVLTVLQFRYVEKKVNY